MRCTVCGLPGARGFKTAGGVEYGPAHMGECHVLKWQAHFNEVVGVEKWEDDLLRWEWRRQRAKARGAAFSEAAPKSPADEALNRAIGVQGWTDVARELE